MSACCTLPKRRQRPAANLWLHTIMIIYYTTIEQNAHWCRDGCHTKGATSFVSQRKKNNPSVTVHWNVNSNYHHCCYFVFFFARMCSHCTCEREINTCAHNHPTLSTFSQQASKLRRNDNAQTKSDLLSTNWLGSFFLLKYFSVIIDFDFHMVVRW